MHYSKLENYYAIIWILFNIFFISNIIKLFIIITTLNFFTFFDTE